MSDNKFLLARKKGMTQIFREDGTVVPVTVLEAGPCMVTGLMSEGHHGYSAVQLGLTPAREKHVSKPQWKDFEKRGVKAHRILREFRVPSTDGFEVGQELGPEVFEVGDVVDVVGKSKGRGFASVIKAHGFARGHETHGSHSVRTPGSIGQCAYPGRVFKGQRMARHYGDEQRTVKNATIEGVDVERGLLLVRGGVPGAPNSLVQLATAKTGRRR